MASVFVRPLPRPLPEYLPIFQMATKNLYQNLSVGRTPLREYAEAYGLFSFLRQDFDTGCVGVRMTVVQTVFVKNLIRSYSPFAKLSRKNVIIHIIYHL